MADEFCYGPMVISRLTGSKNFLIHFYFPGSVILGVIFPMLLLILLYIKRYIQGRYLLKEA
ncbi:hypothetical protein N752_15535 [Desulforamulus aquiferis]|nr:hypothetical protein N752_15535 [Desulforamulus aquiferis]